MKKLTTLLLALLIVASCLAFASCDKDKSCLDGYSHYFQNNGRCMYCHQNRCDVLGHEFINKDSQTGKYYCHNCGTFKSEGASIADGELPIGTVIAVGAIALVVGLIMHKIVQRTVHTFANDCICHFDIGMFPCLRCGLWYHHGCILGVVRCGLCATKPQISWLQRLRIESQQEQK